MREGHKLTLMGLPSRMRRRDVFSPTSRASIRRLGAGMRDVKSYVVSRRTSGIWHRAAVGAAKRRVVTGAVRADRGGFRDYAANRSADQGSGIQCASRLGSGVFRAVLRSRITKP